MGQVAGFSLCQAPTSIGFDCIHTILMVLIEGSTKARPTSIGVELKRLVKSTYARIGAVMQFFQIIKGLLAPATLPDGSLFPASILT